MIITKEKDERIMAEKHKYAYQSFRVMTVLFYITLLFILAFDMSLELIITLLVLIFLTGEFYYSIRLVKAGIYTAASNYYNLKSIKKRAARNTVLFIILFLVVSNFNRLSDPFYIVAIIIVGVILFGLDYTVESYLITRSYKKSMEMLEEEEG
ncbi:DUF6773 family protein [Natronospora cellulosivora (SeqCode)]